MTEKLQLSQEQRCCLNITFLVNPSVSPVIDFHILIANYFRLSSHYEVSLFALAGFHLHFFFLGGGQKMFRQKKKKKDGLVCLILVPSSFSVAKKIAKSHVIGHKNSFWVELIRS